MADPNDEETAQLNATISRDLKRRIDIVAAEQQRKLREIIEEALEAYLKNGKILVRKR